MNRITCAPTGGSSPRPPRAWRTVAVTLAGAVMVACGLDQLTGTAKSITLAVSTDTVLTVGGSKSLVPSATNGTPLTGYRVAWTSASPTVIAVDSSGRVTALAEGTSQVTATVSAPELPPGGLSASRTVVATYQGISIVPIDSLTGLGQVVTPTVRGLDLASSPRAAVTATFGTSDATVLSVVGATLVAKRNGTATITATYAGLTTSTAVKVRQVAKSIGFGTASFVFTAVGRDTTVQVTVKDTRDSLMSATVAWSTTNAGVAIVAPTTGILRALSVASASIRATVDTVVATLPVSVVQVATVMTKTAGDAQAQTAGSATGIAPAVTVTDAGGTPVAGAIVTFTVTSGGGSITGASPATNAVGTATLGSWTLGSTAGANGLQATLGGLNASFTANGVAGAPAKLGVALSPTPSSVNLVGAVLTPSVQIAVRDANNNLIASATTPVTIAIGTNPGTATLGGTKTVAAASGVASFADLTLSAPAAGYTLVASAAGLTAATTAPFTVYGPPVKLAFVVQPSNVVAGASIAPSVQVVVQDAAGNTLSTATNAVTLAIGTNPGSGVLTGGAARPAVNGVAAFGSVNIDKSGAGYTLVASAAGLTSATSGAFTVTTGVASKLVVLTQPTNTAPNVAINPAIEVAVTDASGNVVNTAFVSVTLTLGAGSPAGTLSGPTSASTVSGVASFAGAKLNLVGNGYTLVASATGLSSATTAVFNILAAGPPKQLRFVTQPSTVVAGGNFSPALSIKVVDSVGTTVDTSTAPVTLALGANPNSATLQGTKTMSAVQGVATFIFSLTVNRSGSGATLVASAQGLLPDTSVAFTVTVGAASTLTFVTQPPNVLAGAVIAPAVRVAVTDNQGNVVTSATNQIALSTPYTQALYTLGGSTSIAAVNGVATFSALTLKGAANYGYLTAAATGLATGYSTSFTVSAGTPASLKISTQPTTVGVGSAGLYVYAQLLDAFGNTATTATTQVTASLANNPTGAVLSGTTVVGANSGIAYFSGLALDKAGQGFTLAVSAPGLTSDTSVAFNAIGAVSQLIFTTQPTSTIRNATIAPAVVVEARDAANNKTTSFSGAVTMAIGANSGAGGLAGTLSVNASQGVATFSDLSISAAGTAYTLVAGTSGVTATSAAFDMASFGAASKLAFVVQPTSANINTSLAPAVQVAVQDAQGNAVTNASQSITLSFASNPGGATLSGTTTVAATAGIATFANLQGSAAANGYTMNAAATGLTSATSSLFNLVNPGAAIRLAFVGQPSNTTAGSVIFPAVQVAVQNSAGATVTSDNTTVVTMSLASAPGGGSLRSSTSLSTTVVNGIATFSTLNDTLAGVYSLRASAPAQSALAAATSVAYTITAGTAAAMRFVTQPTNARAGEFFGTPVQVGVTDTYGNINTSATNSVSLYVGCNGGEATSFVLKYIPCAINGTGLGGTLTVAAVNGVATFSDLRPRYTKEITSSGITATATNLTAVSSAPLVVTPSAASQVYVLLPGAQPGTPYRGFADPQTANAVFLASAFVLDSLGNQINTGSNILSLSISSNPGGGSLTVANNIAATNGRADFNVTIDKPGNGYRLSGSSSGLSSLQSSSFDVQSFGTASRLSFTVQPSATALGANIAPAVQVCVQDGVGNTVTNANNLITLALGANPGSATLAGTLSQTAFSGCATFSNLSLNKSGAGYTITASTSGLTGATSTPFTVP